MKLNNQKGISLAEMVVSTLIFAMIASGLLITLIAGNKFHETNQAILTAQFEVRNSITQLTRDLREADNISITVGADSVDLDFTNPNEGAVNYDWTTNSGNANVNLLIRTAGGTARTLARNISAFSVTDASNSVTVNLTSTTPGVLGTGDSMNMIKKITKR